MLKELGVTVHNNLTNHNGTAIHWHGLRQFHTNWQDGVAGVTQCPIMVSMDFSWQLQTILIV
jgi:FtsP/CotA-like multicopper oxidase with cupredoxin domain